MTSVARYRGLAIMVLLAVVIVAVATQVSDGFFIIDEVIYYLGAHALHDTGSFVIHNGFERFPSKDLRIWLLAAGPEGLVQQYPVGSAVLAAPLMGFFGQKTMIFLNVLAGIGTMPVTYALARRLFASEAVALGAILVLALCTFWPEYLFGYWPHSISVLLSMLAL